MQIISKPDDLFPENVDRTILPGVGAVGRYLGKLGGSGFASAIKTRVKTDKVSLLGICFRMQAFATKCLEFGEYDGLDLIEGVVRPTEPTENQIDDSIVDICQ